MLALVMDTLREIVARKVFVAIAIIEIVTLSITAAILFAPGMQRDYDDARLAVNPEVARAERRAAERGTNADTGFSHEDSLLLGIDSTTLADSVQFDSSASRSRALEEGPAADDTSAVHDGDFAQDGPIGELVLEEKVRGELGSFAMPTLFATIFLGLFAVAGIVPSMMEKGTIDLLLSKPLPRWQLLWGRALGGLLAVAGNLLVFTVALWALYGFASGVWHTQFVTLTLLFSLTAFISLYGGVLALNVASESWVLPLSLAYVHVVLLSNFLAAREATIFEWVDSPAVQALVTGLFYALPQTNILGVQCGTAVHTDAVFDWTPFVQGAIFAVVTGAYATWRFSRKDF